LTKRARVRALVRMAMAMQRGRNEALDAPGMAAL
jgi:hypothetical protein